ncbi:hypothetical protein DFH07DRAFT_1063472 [Mycena maculata]|uniref:F-box domain-containing protein n=1 Tax=Mycena maculata TaxID=230809 RepID=A0AAD7IK70_9AGAR|nr:hypothetical protein DFH07DRAFT_1063472 [Mycena maculata]
MSRPSSPLAVTHVSRRWREVALTNSGLWRRVEVSPKDIRHPDLLYERLKRSKGRTICLALDFDAFHAPFDRDALQTVMWIVRRHLGRCYELSVTTPWEAWMDIVAVLLTEVAYKNLIALDLRLLEPAKGSSYFREPYPFYLPDEHKLQRVSLDGMKVKCRSLKYLTEIRMMNEGSTDVSAVTLNLMRLRFHALHGLHPAGRDQVNALPIDAHLFISPLFLRTQRPPLRNLAVVPYLLGHAQLYDPSSTMRRQGLEPHRRRIYTGFMKWPGPPSSKCIDGSRSYRCVHCGFDLARCSHRVSCLNVFAGSQMTRCRSPRLSSNRLAAGASTVRGSCY